MNTRDDIARRIHQEQITMEEMVLLLRQVPDPMLWPEPYRQIFAQAVLPRPSGRVPLSHIEHAKGIRLLLFIEQVAQQRAFQVATTTTEKLPAWILEAAASDRRDPQWERTAERIRHNFPRVFALRQAQEETPSKSGGKWLHQGGGKSRRVSSGDEAGGFDGS